MNKGDLVKQIKMLEEFMPESKNVPYTREEKLILSGLNARDREIQAVLAPLREDYNYWITNLAKRLEITPEELAKQYQIGEAELVFVEQKKEETPAKSGKKQRSTKTAE